MARSNLSPVQRQLARVSRRLFGQTLLESLIWCWAGAFALLAGWFLAQPHLLENPPDWLRWTMAGSLLGVGTIAAVILAIIRAPGQLTAALSLDEKFALKERVTTSLTLDRRDVDTPAGQALLADVNERVASLDVGSKFPLRVPWTACLAPLTTAGLAALAFFYEPAAQQAAANPTAELNKPLANASEIEEKMKQLQKRIKSPDFEEVKSEKLRELEEELDKISGRPRGTKDEVRERVKEMTALEDDMKKYEKELAAKNQAIKDQLKELDRLSKNKNASELEKAMAKGDYNKAKQEMDRLAKKMKENSLTEKEKQDLKNQLKDMEDKLQRLSRQKDEEDRLREMAKNGQLDPEALQRELDQLKQNEKDLQALQEMADLMRKARSKMDAGEPADDELEQLANKLNDLGQDEIDLDDLREKLKVLVNAKDSC